MIDIQIVETVSPEIEIFQRKEWELADLKHFGRIVSWGKESKILKAIQDNNLIGVLDLTIESGVMHIDGLIVKEDKQGNGIGKALMIKAEELAKERKVHKIYLDTGKTWLSSNFYQSLGYTITAELQNHIEHQDYVIYSKFL
ncbi:MAG TPA: GNAT family N-acetyltransferase [Candidatus Saccharimonadales bacterium]|nr:GNAT family N-acetyltransferase [Candidatus Saccharimonadales bacterium]